MDTNNAIVISPENLTPVIQSAPAILNDNRTRVENAKTAGTAFLEKVKSGMTEILYQQGLEYMTKVRKTVNHINDKRKPITQLLSEVSKAFTSLELDLDEKKAETIPGKVQKALNDYAQQQLLIKQEQERIAAEKLRIENAKIEIKADISNKVNAFFYETMASYLGYMNNLWGTITLENFEEVTTNILNADGNFDPSMLSQFEYKAPQNSPVEKNEILQIKKAVIEGKLDEFREIYEANYKIRKDEIELEFNSKYDELNRIANANAEEAERLQKEAEEREKKKNEDAALKQQEALNAANMQNTIDKETEKIGTLFDVSAGISTPSISMKATYEIEIKNIAGWMAVISFWFEKEAKTMSMEQMEKKFGFARKFAETQYNKNDEKINSPFLTYKQVAKAK